MKTVQDLKNEFSLARSVVAKTEVEGVKKLKVFRAVRGGLQEIERAAASDFGFPLREIMDLKSFLPVVEDQVAYMEQRARANRWNV